MPAPNLTPEQARTRAVAFTATCLTFAAGFAVLDAWTPATVGAVAAVVTVAVYLHHREHSEHSNTATNIDP